MAGNMENMSVFVSEDGRNVADALLAVASAIRCLAAAVAPQDVSDRTANLTEQLIAVGGTICEGLRDISEAVDAHV